MQYKTGQFKNWQGRSSAGLDDVQDQQRLGIPIGDFKKRGMMACPNECGAVYFPSMDNGRPGLKAIVVPAFEDDASEENDD